MIRRETDDGFLLISQVDHARLAGDLAANWGNERVPGLPLAEWLVPAVRDHDEGWRAAERSIALTADGLPRQFIETDPAEAARIWTASIEVCAGGFPSSSEALRRLRADGGEVTPDDAAVLDALLAHRGSFPVGRFTDRLISEDAVSAAAVAESLDRFRRKGLVAPLPNAIGGPATAITLLTVGTSPLGGIWVSRHFCALAKQARGRAAGRSDEVASLDGFLAEQSAKQAGWAAAVREFAGEELERVLDTGFRYVRFFDAFSLWLCCAERDEAFDLSLSRDLTLRLTPRSEREIAVEPWPFDATSLEFSTPAVRWSAGQTTGERTTLRWVLVA